MEEDMRSPICISLDTALVSRTKALCDKANVGMSAYIEYLITNGPEIDENLGQWITQKKKGKAVGTLDSFKSRKPVMEHKGWHFHEEGRYCGDGPSCEKERHPATDMYYDENDKLVNI